MSEVRGFQPRVLMPRSRRPPPLTRSPRAGAGRCGPPPPRLNPAGSAEPSLPDEVASRVLALGLGHVFLGTQFSHHSLSPGAVASGRGKGPAGLDTRGSPSPGRDILGRVYPAPPRNSELSLDAGGWGGQEAAAREKRGCPAPREESSHTTVLTTERGAKPQWAPFSAPTLCSKATSSKYQTNGGARACRS